MGAFQTDHGRAGVPHLWRQPRVVFIIYCGRSFKSLESLTPQQGFKEAVMPMFEIFRGHYRDKDVVWLEAAESLAAARGRMEKIAAETPGPYFVFSVHDHLVLATVDTTNRRAKNAGAA